MSSGHEASGQEASRPGSGVLARMIQRSREPLSSLEPVIQPRFAPRAGGFAPGDDSAPDALPSDVLPPDALPSDAPPLDALPPDALPPEARPPDVLRSEALPPDALPPGGRSPGALPPAAPGAVISGLPGAFRVAESGYRSPRHVTSTPGGGAGTPAVGSAAEDDFASGDELTLLDAGRPSRRARAASDWPGPSRAAGREYLSEQRSYRSEAAVAGEPGHEAGAREPSVTITIGHIEVRAAPAPQRPPRRQAPQRPRFRPQTTLAGFLDDGAGRPGGSGRR
jgi:hypothetical protein